MIIMGQWTWVENNNEVFLQVTNHTEQAEKNLLGPAGIRTRDLRFTSPMLYQLHLRLIIRLILSKILNVFMFKIILAITVYKVIYFCSFFKKKQKNPTLFNQCIY